MPSIAEILANPAKYTPTRVLQALVSKHGYDPNGISGALKSVGFDATPTAIHRWIKKNHPDLVPVKPGKVHKVRQPAKPYVMRFSKLFGHKIQKPNRAPQYAAARRQAFQSAGSLEDLATLLARKVRVKGPRKPYVYQRKDPAQTLIKRQESYIRRFGQPQFVDAVAQQVGARLAHYTHKPRKHYGFRRIGGGVAMNPAFGNPAFDFSFRTLTRNLSTGGQTAAGAIAGIAGAKYANQLIVAPLAKNLFKQDDAGIVGRIVSSLLAGTVLSALSRSFIPGELGDKIADGSFAGAVMYVAGGIKMNDKVLLPIGDLIHDKDGTWHVSQPVAAYATAPRVADEMADNMSAVSTYDVHSAPIDSDESEVSKW